MFTITFQFISFPKTSYQTFTTRLSTTSVPVLNNDNDKQSDNGDSDMDDNTSFVDEYTNSDEDMKEVDDKFSVASSEARSEHEFPSKNESEELVYR